MAEVKFPLSKKARQQFADQYEAIYMRKPVHNITDEKLVEMVNSQPEILQANENSQPKPEQKTTSDEESQDGNSIEATGTESKHEFDPAEHAVQQMIDTGTVADGTEVPGVGADEAKKAQQAEREFQFNEYERLHGEPVDGNLSTEEITAMNTEKKNFDEASNQYFDLFGKTPNPDMTKEQLFSSIQIEKARQAEGGQQSPAKTESASEDGLDYDPETQMIVVSKTDKDHKVVINKGTFEFLKNDYEAVSKQPKELQNFKK